MPDKPRIDVMNDQRPRLFAVVPTLLTLGNAVCGFGAITYAAQVGPDEVGTRHLQYAGLLIFAAMLFDMLDGHVARWARQTSDFGAQLDSLCDAISFGVAPAVVMLAFCDQYQGRLLWVIGVLFTLAAVLRLARFNVESDDDDTHEVFTGLPSTAAAGTIAAFVIARPSLRRFAGSASAGWIRSLAEWGLGATVLILPVLTLVLACLMVSRVRYPHVINRLFRGRRPYHHVVQLLLAMVVIFVVRELAAPLVLCGFALGPPLRAGWLRSARHLTRAARQPP